MVLKILFFLFAPSATHWLSRNRWASSPSACSFAGIFAKGENTIVRAGIETFKSEMTVNSFRTQLLTVVQEGESKQQRIVRVDRAVMYFLNVVCERKPVERE